MIDTLRVVSLVFTQTAKHLKGPSDKALRSHITNRAQLKKIKNTVIQSLGTLCCEFVSIGWNGGKVYINLFPNNHQTKIRRDLFEKYSSKRCQFNTVRNVQISNGILRIDGHESNVPMPVASDTTLIAIKLHYFF